MMSQQDPAKEVRPFELLICLLDRFTAFNRKFRQREIRLTLKQSIVELMAEGGLYPEMFDTQTEGYR